MYGFIAGAPWRSNGHGDYDRTAYPNAINSMSAMRDADGGGAGNQYWHKGGCGCGPTASPGMPMLNKPDGQRLTRNRSGAKFFRVDGPFFKADTKRPGRVWTNGNGASKSDYPFKGTTPAQER